jgi:alpha-mannosidase
MVELDGRPVADVRLSFASPVVAAREVNAQEQPIGPASIRNGALIASFTAYQPRTFALRLAAPPAKMNPGHSQPVTLAYNLAVASNDDTKTVGGGFDGKGDAIPAEMLPSQINYRNVQFDLEPSRTGVPDAIAAKDQTIQLPPGHYNRVYLLAASANGDQKAVFRVGRKAVTLNIQDWSGFIGA